MKNLAKKEKPNQVGKKLARTFSIWCWGKVMPTEVSEIERFFLRFLEESKLTPIEPLKKEKMIDLESSPVETPVRSAVEELSEKEFCRMYTQYHGEEINNIRQLVCASFSGEELMEFVQHCLKSRPSVVGESRIKELEATIDSLRNQIEYAAEATRKYVGEKEEQRKLLIEIMKEDEKHGMYEASERSTIEDMREAFDASWTTYCPFDEWIKTRRQ